MGESKVAKTWHVNNRELKGRTMKRGEMEKEREGRRKEGEKEKGREGREREPIH